MDSNETDDTNDQIINNEEPIILPIPVSLSQLMGSFMNNMIYTTNIVNTNNVINHLSTFEKALLGFADKFVSSRVRLI